MRAHVEYLAPGETGTFQAIERLRGMARAAHIDPLVRSTAASLVLGIPGYAGTAQARALGRWIETHTTFLADPRYAEAFHDPRWMLERVRDRGVVQGDCDDIALLTAALGLSIGLRARVLVVGFRVPEAPLQHIWTELADPRSLRWVPIDPTRPAQGLAGVPIARGYVRDL